VADQHGVAVAVQDLVQGHGIAGQGVDPIAAIGRDRGRGVAAQERCDRVEARLGQHRQELPPGVGAVREAVQTQRQRAGSGLQQPELQPVGQDHASPRHHGPTLPQSPALELRAHPVMLTPAPMGAPVTSRG
jgi:hypothetical protein